MAQVSSQSLDQACHLQNLDIFADNHDFYSCPDSHHSSRGSLLELSIEQAQNIAINGSNIQTNPEATADLLIPRFERLHIATPPEPKSNQAKFNSRGLQRRPAILSDTFESLSIVEEETSTIIDDKDEDSSSPRSTRHLQSLPAQDENCNHTHPLEAARQDCTITQQIQKHLAGQFEWLISYPAPASSTSDKIFLYDDGGFNGQSVGPRASERRVYGCNLLSRKDRSYSTNPGCPLADTYTFVATKLEGDALPFTKTCRPTASLDSSSSMELPDLYDVPDTVIRLHPPTTPLKEHDMGEIVEQAVSPSLTVFSDRSSSFMGSPRAGYFSIPRIEDSLEELDRLEDELEAVHAVAQAGRRLGSEENKTSAKPSSPNMKSKTITKRSSVGSAANVRFQEPKARAQPPIRQSRSRIFNDKKQQQPAPKAEKPASRLPRMSSSVEVGTPSSKPTVKSTKPLTIPKFELPGEATFRRLKEQREARKAQRAEAEKTPAPPRARSSKPLPKPTFELPGEAISRRKREEREAKLKAQEEEERKKREFKARPLRHSVTPGAVPRETISSLARQDKLEEASKRVEKSSATMNPKRASTSSLRLSQPASLAERPPQGRGRIPYAAPPVDTSRATSTSTCTSNSAKRHTLSSDHLQQLRLRGKDIFERDNKSIIQDKERTRLEREAVAKLAREQAAERSRALSREWAEKKRRKELALREGMGATQ